MSQLSDELAAVQANLDATSATLTNVAAGVLALDQIINDFQNSPGTLSPEDQAALDKIQSASNALAAQASAISTTPPTPPVPPTARR